MGALFLTTILSCQQVVGIANRLVSINLLTPQQKIEIFMEIRKNVPSCPIKIIKDDGRKSN